MQKFDKKRIILTFSMMIGFLIIFPIVFYIFILPSIVSNQNILNMVESAMKKNFGVNTNIQSPVLKTSLSPNLGFSVKNISITKDKETYLNIENFETEISFAKIFRKNIILKKFGVDYFYLDTNKILSLLGESKTQQQKQKNKWSIEWLNAVLYAKKCLIYYSLDENTSIKIDCKNMEITSQREPKFVRFNIAIDLEKNKEKIKLYISDNNKVYIKNKKLFVEKGILGINNSNIFLDVVADEKNNFDLTLSSKKFDVKNVVELLNTNFVIPNGKEILSFFKDIDGFFNLKINLTNTDLSGYITLDKASLKIIPLNNLPIFLNKGIVELNKDTITLKDFKGWYSNNKNNIIDLSGSVLDYTKSVDTNIEINGLATDDLIKNYISKVVGIPLNLTGPCPAQILVKSIYNKMDFTFMGKIPTGSDILVDGSSLSPITYDRAVKADMHLEDDMLNIKSINYYIAKELTTESKGKVKPILTLHGNYDCKNFIVKNLGFKIPNPLPSEFLNVLISQRLFKNGTISGEMEFDNTGKTPVLNGKLAMQKVHIPTQRLSIQNASFYTNKDLINIVAKGRFKKSSFDFNGKILNELIFPIIVKDVKLSVDNVDIDRIMHSMNQQNTQNVSSLNKKEELLVNSQSSTKVEIDQENDDTYTFDTGLIVVEKCILEVIKGFYKEIHFGNLIANLTLNKDGILDIKSNHFNFAEGVSSLKINCDLKNHNYYIKLGVKDINSDLIASTLLALPREISGKATGLIDLNTDKTFKLNGRILFDISNGTIQKVGLIEYALKFASIFRNPLAMLSPSLLFDMVNIPEGDFDKINGHLEIKNNIIQKMMIKSSASQLSSFIVGRYDLETKDTSLRIYTKFSNKNKGFTGFIRNISLNSLANRISLGKKNEINYYALELEQLPKIDANEKDCQIFLTKIEGDVEHFNFLSSVKKIK